MKNATALISIIAFTGMVLPVMVSAQVETTVEVKTEPGRVEGRGFLGMFGNREAAQEERQQQRAENKGTDVQTRSMNVSAEARMNLEENRKVRIEKHADRIYGTLSAALERLSGFEAKVEARLDELEEKDIDVSLSREKLEAASTARVTATANIATLEADLKATLGAETSRNEIMAIMKEARKELVDVRKAYAAVLIQMRADVNASK